MVFQEGTSGRYMSMSIFLIPVGKVYLVSLIGIVCVYHLSIGRKVNIIINQLKLKVKTGNLLETRENASDQLQVEIGSSFVFDRLLGWRDFS